MAASTWRETNVEYRFMIWIFRAEQVSPEKLSEL
jgi:hypothetical protein